MWYPLGKLKEKDGNFPIISFCEIEDSILKADFFANEDKRPYERAKDYVGKIDDFHHIEFESFNVQLDVICQDLEFTSVWK